MSTQPIVESGMTFGPYPDDHSLWHIEKSKLCRKLSEKSVKLAEFLLLKPGSANTSVVWIVEAKSSAPKPHHHDEYLKEIAEKLTDTLSLGLAAILKRHAPAEAGMPDRFGQLDLSTVAFKLVLVVKSHKPEWLTALQDSLRKELRATVEIWKLGPSSVTVINDEIARNCKLIQY